MGNLVNFSSVLNLEGTNWKHNHKGLKTNPSAAILTLHSFILPSSQPIISLAFLDSSTTLKKKIKVSVAKHSNTRPLDLARVVLLNVPQGSLKLVEIFLHLCDAFCTVSIFLQDISFLFVASDVSQNVVHLAELCLTCVIGVFEIFRQ